MKRLFARSVLAVAAAMAVASAAVAAPLPYSTTNIPLDTPQALGAAIITAINASAPDFSYTATCTGTTTATCTGNRFIVSVTGLTTAAGVTSASMAVTDSSVTAASIVQCEALGYGGTGNARATNVVATASTVTFQVQNTHASAALNATVPVACMVYN
jgi:hypothetical protein